MLSKFIAKFFYKVDLKEKRYATHIDEKRIYHYENGFYFNWYSEETNIPKHLQHIYYITPWDSSLENFPIDSIYDLISFRKSLNTFCIGL